MCYHVGLHVYFWKSSLINLAEKHHYFPSSKCKSGCLYFYIGNISTNPITYLQSELTCVSVGGPATTVTWVRISANSEKTVLKKNSQMTALDDVVKAQYIHTQNIGDDVVISGVYECFVSNNKPSSAKAVATLTENGMLFI